MVFSREFLFNRLLRNEAVDMARLELALPTDSANSLAFVGDRLRGIVCEHRVHEQAVVGAHEVHTARRRLQRQ